MIAEVSSYWTDILCILPGYDPFAQSEGFYFDESEAQFRIDFVEEFCTHVDGKLAGQPVILEPWQKSLHANIYGWKSLKNNLRRFRESFIYVPRGNAKTTTAATFILSSSILDGEYNAEIISAAAEREQARICFDIFRGMIENNKRLRDAAEIFKKHITINTCTYKAISAEASSKHGGRTHLLINDEVHAHKSAELTETLQTSQMKRDQPLCIHLTTADFDRPSLCNRLHDYAGKVRDGLIRDPKFLPVIYEASPDDDWTSEETIAKANPNWPVMVQDQVRGLCQRAQDDLGFTNTFKRLHLNLKTSSNFAYFNMQAWDKSPARMPIEEAKKKKCFAGLDMASVQDLTAFVIVVPEYKEITREVEIEGKPEVVQTHQIERLDVFPWFWVPEEAVSQRNREKSLFGTYSKWQHEGLLNVQSGARIEQAEIREHINQLRNEGWQIEQIAYDPHGCEALRQDLSFDGFEMLEFNQSHGNYSEPMKDLGGMVIEQRVRHDNNPILRWNISNTLAHENYNAEIRPDKKKSIDKIDGAVALIMGHALAIENKQMETEAGLIAL